MESRVQDPVRVGARLAEGEPFERGVRVRFWLFLVNGALAIALGFWLIPEASGLSAIKYAGVWVMLVTFVVFVWALVLTIRRAGSPWWRDRREWAALASIPVGWSVLLRHEPFGFKIIMDEIMLLGTSMSLHLDKLVQVPLRGNDLQGAFVIAEGSLDKRPYFFPFLLSLVHDASGYRPENAFVLNAILALVLLVTTYVLGRALAGRSGAVVGVLLLASLPLLAQNATGGGFDLLNLLMIALTAWLALRFAATRGEVELVALCYALVLLAQTRYESVLFVAAAGALVGWIWWREKRLVLPWLVTAVPLLLVPAAFMLRRYSGNSAEWEMASQGQVANPMGWTHVAANLKHAWIFLFDRDGNQPSSIVFSVAGITALVVLAIGAVRATGRLGGRREVSVVVVVFCAALGAHTAILMTYFWGRFDDPVIARLSLPLHLLFLVALWTIVPRGKVGTWIWRALAVAAAVQIWSISIPKMAAHAYTLQNVQAQEVAWRREFVAAHPARDFLVIDPYSIVWLTHRVSATTPAQTRAQPEAIAYHLRSRSYHDILVFQRFEVNADTGKLTLLPEFDVGPALVLETVAERRVQPYAVARLSRVVSVAGTP